MWSRSAPAARRYSVYRSTLEMIWSKASKLQGGRDAGSQHFHTPDQFLLCCPGCCCRHSLRPLPDVSHCKHPASSCSWCHRNLQYYRNRTHGDKTQFREVQNHIENTFQRVLLLDYWFHEKLCVVKGNNQFVLKQFLWNTSKLCTVVRLSWILVLSTNFFTNPSCSTLHNIVLARTLPNVELQAKVLVVLVSLGGLRHISAFILAAAGCKFNKLFSHCRKCRFIKRLRKMHCNSVKKYNSLKKPKTKHSLFFVELQHR